MKEIRIEGLRSLKDSTYIPIKPLTILLGENSSGKSTFLNMMKFGGAQLRYSATIMINY
jgi:predicted ATPase